MHAGGRCTRVQCGASHEPCTRAATRTHVAPIEARARQVPCAAHAMRVGALDGEPKAFVEVGVDDVVSGPKPFPLVHVGRRGLHDLQLTGGPEYPNRPRAEWICTVPRRVTGKQPLDFDHPAAVEGGTSARGCQRRRCCPRRAPSAGGATSRSAPAPCSSCAPARRPQASDPGTTSPGPPEPPRSTFGCTGQSWHGRAPFKAGTYRKGLTDTDERHHDHTVPAATGAPTG